MTERKLGVEVDFGHGAVQLRKIEERIVAEAAGAARSAEDDAFHAAVRCVFGPPIAGSDQDAVVTGCALFGWSFSEALQEDHVVPDVGVVIGSVRRVDDAYVGGEARGSNSGS